MGRLAYVRKVAMLGFLWPRHTMPMLTKPLRRHISDLEVQYSVPAYHEVCWFTRASGRAWTLAKFHEANPPGSDLGLLAGYKGTPDLLDVLRAPR